MLNPLHKCALCGGMVKLILDINIWRIPEMGILFYAQACIRKPAADAILGRAASRGKIFSTRSYRLKWNAHVSLIFKGKADILCIKE